MTLCAHASCLHALILLAGPPISVSVWPEPGSHVYLSPADGARPHCSSPCAVKTLMVPVVPQVVPACYRRAFPVHLKSHRSHDVVLLCFDCHEVASKAAERLKGTIARCAAESFALSNKEALQAMWVELAMVPRESSEHNRACRDTSHHS